MAREDNIVIFEDTKRLYSTNPRLKESIQRSLKEQEMFREDAPVPIGKKRVYDKDACIIVSQKRSFEAAQYYAYQEKKVCVLNFASATNPGGGVERGSSAQEEALCRISTLFPNLSDGRMMKNFYIPHRISRDPLHNDDTIYTPNVVVFKSDTGYPKELDEKRWYKVDVITTAAPNLRQRPSNRMNPGDGDMAVDISREELLALHEKRIHRILEIASEKGNEVIILGAFGCGAFSNPPEVVAEAMKREIEKFRKNFETIEAAVYCSPRDDSNYQVFKRVLGGLSK